MKKLGETVPSSSFIFKSKKTGEIIGGPRKLGDAFPIRKNVKDASGHEHGSDGRFTNGMTSPSQIKAKHTDVHGTVDHDGIVAETTRRGGYPPTSSSQRTAVFMVGGGGSGKGGIVEQYTGTPKGKKDHDGNPIVPGHKDYNETQPGFHNAPIFDADAEKKKNPVYSPEVNLRPGAGKHEKADPANDGKYGPSGPKTWEDFAKYSPEEQAAIREHVKAQTGMELEDFAAHPTLQEDNEKLGTHFGGGLTHEVSSYRNKDNLKHALETPGHGNFVYDSVGSAEYIKHAEAARRNGYHVIIHHVDTPRAVAHKRNQERGRTVDPKDLNGTHDKVARIMPALRAHAESPEGRHIEMRHSTPWTEDDLKDAVDAGYTDYGPAGYGPDGKKR